MPLQATSGAASYDAFGGGVPVVPNYIEDVFQTWLYDGTSATQTITNSIDLSTKSGLVWIKNRNGTYFNTLFDTVRGTSQALYTNTTDAQTGTSGVTAFNTTGFTLGAGANTNAAGYTFASWTFRKQPKFFDVVTFTTGDTHSGSAYTFNHNLGSAPAFVLIKCTSTAGAWFCYHRSTGTTKYLLLNDTSAAGTLSNGNWASTSTTFSVPDEAFSAGTRTYVAYLFAHNAGGFGLTGTDNVISCGSYTGVGGGNVATITLGYEPQWILVKRADNSAGGNWAIFDNMRGMSVNSTDNASMLNPNLSDAESVLSAFKPTATGFQTGDNFTASGGTYIYIAIRRGPMKVPTSGTSVFSPEAFTGNATTRTIGGILTDSLLLRERASDSWNWSSRLTGSDNYLETNSTAAEGSATAGTRPSYTKAQLGVVYNGATKNQSGTAYIDYLFRRAPSFFDVVCWTSNDTYPQVLNHNLTVAPELIIRKPRSISDEWAVGFNFQTSSYKKMALNTTAAQTSYGSYSSGEFPGKPTATQFTDQGSASGRTFVAYLFATCAGVSKVGSYTGTATTLQIDCGFTAGARFVLIKRTDSTGDWYVWDSARGIVSGNDPYLLLNSTAAEVTNTDYIDTYSAGFEISSTAPAAINASGGSFIFLAIA